MKTLYNFINSNHLHNYDIIPHDIENNIDSSFFIDNETRELTYNELRIIYKSLLIIIIIVIFTIKSHI